MDWTQPTMEQGNTLSGAVAGYAGAPSSSGLPGGETPQAQLPAFGQTTPSMLDQLGANGFNLALPTSLMATLAPTPQPQAQTNPTTPQQPWSVPLPPQVNTPYAAPDYSQGASYQLPPMNNVTPQPGPTPATTPYPSAGPGNETAPTHGGQNIPDINEGPKGPPLNQDPYGTGIPQPHLIQGSQYGPNGELGLEDLGMPGLTPSDQAYLAGLGVYYNPQDQAAIDNYNNWALSQGLPAYQAPMQENLPPDQYGNPQNPGPQTPPLATNPYGTGAPQPHVISSPQNAAYGANGQLDLSDLGNPGLSESDQFYLAGLGLYYNPTDQAAIDNYNNWAAMMGQPAYQPGQ